MKSTKYWMLLVTVLSAFFCVSCGSLPKDESENALGPLSDEDTKPWNRRQQWEGQGLLGGFGR